MSHFSVAVFSAPTGLSVEDLLAPFDEDIEVPKYVRRTKEELIQEGKKEIADFKEGLYAEFLANPDKYETKCRNLLHLDYIKNEFPKKLLWTDEEIYQNEIRLYDESEIGENGEIFSTYNPKSKWDWYEIGGRFSGMLHLKEGTTGKVGSRSWTNANEYIPNAYVDEALVKNIDFADDFGTYAVVTPDGIWHEKGQMGWWGMSSETDDESASWNSQYKEKFIDAADPNWILTIVDCHI